MFGSNKWYIAIGWTTTTHLQKQETVSSMSSGSACGGAVGDGAGGTLRYLTCSTRRAARAPLRRKMPTGQRRDAASSPPSPASPALMLRSHAFTTMHRSRRWRRRQRSLHHAALLRETKTSRTCARRVSNIAKNRSRLRSAADWRRRREAEDEPAEARALTSRLISARRAPERAWAPPPPPRGARESPRHATSLRNNLVSLRSAQHSASTRQTISEVSPFSNINRPIHYTTSTVDTLHRLRCLRTILGIFFSSKYWTGSETSFITFYT